MRKPVVLLFALACACKGTKEHGEAPGPGTTASAAAPQASAGLRIFVDDQQVSQVEPAQVASWPRLDTLVPEPARRLGMWQAISFEGAAPAELARPFETYRDYVPALFPGEDGGISFGMFDPVELGKRGKPAVREDRITALRVKLDTSGMRGENDHGGGQAIDPAKVELAFVLPSGTTTLTGDQLLALPREPMPGGGGDAKGWRLQALLDAAGVKTYGRLRLIDAGGTNLTFARAELDATRVPFIKLNRQGALRFRVYEQQGEGWTSAADLRSLAKVEILP